MTEKWRVFKGNDPKYPWEAHAPGCPANKQSREPYCLYYEDDWDSICEAFKSFCFVY